MTAYDLHYTKAIFYYNQKKYLEAIDEFKQALAVKPDERDALYYLGVAMNKAGQNKEAEETLKKVMELDPTFEKVHFDLGVVEYELGQYPEALQELGLAEKAEVNNAFVYYYQGLIYHHLGNYERSSPLFLRAMALDPGLSLTSHYYAGVGFYRRGVYPEAQKDFEEVVKIDPNSKVAQSAREFLAQLESHQPAVAPAAESELSLRLAKRWDLNVSMAYQWDSNVVLVAGGSPLPQGISNKSDSRIVFHLKGIYRFLETANWTMGGGYSFYQSLNFHLNSYDVQINAGHAFIVFRPSWGEVRIPYDFDYDQVNQESYLYANMFTPTLKIVELPVTFTEVQFGFTSKHFENTAQFPTNSDRDAYNGLFGIAQSLQLNTIGRVRVGYAFDSDVAGTATPQEKDWSYNGQKVTVDLTAYAPGDLTLNGLNLEGLKFDVGMMFYIQAYDNPNTFASDMRKRKDNIQTYTVTLSKSLLHDWVTVSAQYFFDRNGSNIPVFGYDRTVGSLIVEGKF
jgi:tetratricopeptide (TPR) repeat protein